ncbi:MAG: hypothetical protein ACLQJR_10325 [Stellaceae bacterium]
MYKIECDQSGTTFTVPMSFPDKDAALTNARELLSAGFRVARVVGPGFEMTADALIAPKRAPQKDHRSDADRTL